MSSRWDRDSKLRRDLRLLGAQIAAPEAPAMPRAIGDELRRAGSRRRAPFLITRPRRRLAAAIVAGVLMIAGTAAAARLVIGAIAIRSVPSLAPASPETGPNLGTETTLRQATRMASFRVLVPTALGEPDGVFVDAGRVSLVWNPETPLPRIPGTPWGAVLVELRGEAIQGVKEAPEGTSITAVRVGGRPGFYIGGPTDLLLSGGKRLSVRGGVVLWQQGATTLRLESMLGRSAAVRLSETAK